MRKSPRLRHTALATGLLLLGLATACGGSSDESADSGDAAGDTSLGSKNAATASPVKIGYVNEGQLAAIDTTGEERAAKAVAAYANDYLGGLAGHKIELDICQAKGTPSGGQTCGSQFVRNSAVVVGGASPGGPDPVIAQLGPAGIPFVANQLASQTALHAKNVFILSNPLAVFGTPAQYAKDNGYKRVALVVIDLPNAAAAVKQIAPLVFGNAGVTVDPVLVAPGTADMTPQIQTALRKKPDEWFVLGEPNFCSTAAKAFQTLAVSGARLYVSNCLNASAGKAIPGLATSKFVSSFDTTSGNADTALMNAVFKKYGDVKADASAITGFQSMLGLIRLINAGAPTEVTAATVSAAIKAAPAVDLPLGKGIKVQCTSPIAAISPNICSTAGLLAEANPDGTLKNAQLLDAAALYKLPTGK